MEPSLAAPPGATKPRVLFLTPGPVPPSSDARRNAQFFLSEYLTGDLVSTTWAQSDAEAERFKRAADGALGSFGYHALRVFGVSPFIRPMRALWYYVRTGLALSRRDGKYDAIVVYGPFTTGIAGLLLSRLTGAPLIVDMPGHPFRGFALAGGRFSRLKARIARHLAPFVLNRADAIKLLYPEQLADVPVAARRTAVFHDFTAVSLVRSSEPRDDYILLLGHPYYLKGVDVLIRAFRHIEDRHPDIRLMIVGHCPDRAPFERLTDGDPRISFRPGVFHEEAIDLIERCAVFVNPSRTEAMGRAILEAFAAKRPVVASRVDGIPQIVQHELTGLLAPPGDVGELATQLDRVLSDRSLATKLAARAYDAVRTDWTEAIFARKYHDLIVAVMNERKRSESPVHPNHA